MSPHQAQFKPAIHTLYCLTVHALGYIDVRCQRPGEVAITHSHRIGRNGGPRLAETVQRFDERFSDEMSMRLPRARPRWGTVASSSILWCRLEGTDQYERAKQFRPHPTVVLQEGASSRRLLIWGLLDPLGWERCRDLNRRIAYRVGAVQKHAEPDTLEIPMPGTCLHIGRSRPVPIRVARCTMDLWDAERVAGRLKDPPPADAWLQRVAS